MDTTEIATARRQYADIPDHALATHETPNFDSLAHIYRWMEYFSFGPMLARCRFRFLDRCVAAHNALMLGDGDGRFTARLMAVNHTVRVEAIDCSSAMLRQLARGVRRNVFDAEARLETCQVDFTRFVPHGTYDLIVSHFSLDCLTSQQIENLAERLRPHLAPNATWIISEFAIPQTSWRRIAGRLLVRTLYIAFRWMTQLRVRQIPDYSRILAGHGFQRREQACHLGGLLTAEVWERDSKEF